MIGNQIEPEKAIAVVDVAVVVAAVALVAAASVA